MSKIPSVPFIKVLASQAGKSINYTTASMLPKVVETLFEHGEPKLMVGKIKLGRMLSGEITYAPNGAVSSADITIEKINAKGKALKKLTGFISEQIESKINDAGEKLIKFKQVITKQNSTKHVLTNEISPEFKGFALLDAGQRESSVSFQHNKKGNIKSGTIKVKPDYSSRPISLSHSGTEIPVQPPIPAAASPTPKIQVEVFHHSNNPNTAYISTSVGGGQSTLGEISLFSGSTTPPSGGIQPEIKLVEVPAPHQPVPVRQSYTIPPEPVGVGIKPVKQDYGQPTWQDGKPVPWTPDGKKSSGETF